MHLIVEKGFLLVRRPHAQHFQRVIVVLRDMAKVAISLGDALHETA